MDSYYHQNTEEYDRNNESFIIYALHGILNETKNSSFKGTALLADSHLLFYNYKKQPADKIFFHKLKQIFLSYNMAIILPERIIYQSTFKFKINQLIHGGFFDHWMNKYLHHPSLLKKQEDDNKVVLTMDHLSVGFSIWLAMLLIASMMFITELARSKIAKYFREKIFKM